MNIDASTGFVHVGERTNVTGSAVFRRLIEADDYAAAVQVARQQVDAGANLLDVNMDEGLLDSEAAMRRYINLLAAEPDISQAPIMIDSSRFGGAGGRSLEMPARQGHSQFHQPQERRSRSFWSRPARFGGWARRWW